MKNKKDFTEKEKMFIKEYLIDFNATQAATRAGYSKKTACAIGSENLRKPHIQQAIAEEVNARINHLDLSRDYVLNGLKELVDRCMQKVPVMAWTGRGKNRRYEQVKEFVEHEDGTTTEEGVWRFDSKGVAAGLRMLGEHYALFKTVHSNDPDNPLPSGGLTGLVIIPSNGREPDPKN